ncbi:MAG: hypothetical protein QOG63_2771 [Thermoleophilaceae bacterium]|nr:hypothetical protein [Thermoleophilaceae bacterium]
MSTLALLSLVPLVAGVAALVRLHLVTTGLDPMRDAVSDYGTTPYHWLYRFQVVAFGLSAALLTAALADAGGGVRTSGLVWLAIYAGARMAIAGFMIDRDVPAPTTQGRIHIVLATLAFTAIAVAASTIGPDLGGTVHSLGWAVVAAAVGTAVCRVVPQLMPSFGAVERLLYVATVAWLVATALDLA